MDPCDGDDHVEDLLECEVFANFMSLLCGKKEWTGGREHSGAAFSKYGATAAPMREQLSGDVTLAGRKGEEPVEPCDECRPGRLPADCLGGLADGINFIGVESFEKFTAIGKVAIQRGHPDTGAS